MATKIYQYRIECPRSSDICGTFLLTDRDLKAIVKKLEGVEVYYGEVAGKHSEVYQIFQAKDLKMVSDKPEEVKLFKKLFKGGVGFDFKGHWLEYEV